MCPINKKHPFFRSIFIKTNQLASKKGSLNKYEGIIIMQTILFAQCKIHTYSKYTHKYMKKHCIWETKTTLLNNSWIKTNHKITMIHKL